MLVRLLYVSHVVTEAGDQTDAILNSARKNNPPLGITGILCYCSGNYLQAIEGGRNEVNALYGKLLTDPRHRDVVLLDYQEISERRFGGWSMGQVNLAKVNASIVLKYSEKPEFDPYKVSGKVAMALLDELIATASIVSRH